MLLNLWFLNFLNLRFPKPFRFLLLRKLRHHHFRKPFRLPLVLSRLPHWFLRFRLPFPRLRLPRRLLFPRLRLRLPYRLLFP
jgi:hypothetical protein